MKKAPKPPDPAKTAAAVSEYNQAANERNLQYGSVDRAGPGGSSTFSRDENGLPTGITNTLDPSLQPSFGNTAGALGSQTGALPTGFNFDNSTVGNIVNTGMANYDALAADPNRQQMDSIKQQIANRGLPINDQISQDLTGNALRQQGLARGNVNAQLLAQAPNMQSTLDLNTIRQGMAPAAAAQTSLGLLGGLNSLVPQANQPVSNEASAGGTYANQVNSNYDQAMKEYQANQAGLGSLLKTGAGLALMPLTGGFSSTLLGTGLGALGGLFNSSGSGGSGGIGHM